MLGIFKISLSAQPVFFSQEEQKSVPSVLSPDKSEPVFTFVLHPCYPNPLTGDIPVHYEIQEPGHYVVAIVGSRGTEILRLVDKYHLSGEFKLYVSPSARAHGIYMYKVEKGSPTSQRRLFLFKY